MEVDLAHWECDYCKSGNFCVTLIFTLFVHFWASAKLKTHSVYFMCRSMEDGWKENLKTSKKVSKITEVRKITCLKITTFTVLRVQAFFHKTVRVCHVYCNFKLGFTFRITIIFGTLKDGSLLINTLASNICFSYRNMFQNGVDALSKIVDAFCQKAQNFI